MKKSRSSDSETANRTGVMTSPGLAQELVEGVDRLSPKPDLDLEGAAKMRAPYITAGQPVGTFPKKTAAKLQPLVDKLSARLAFERSGVRLYDAMVQKREALGGKAKPTVADLRHIRKEELEHMHMLERHILDMGGDPTVVTPLADVVGVMTSGVLKVVCDHRTTMTQCLEAILAAELIDNDGWTMLIREAEDQGMRDAAADFEDALETEQEHLEKVRNWLKAESAAA